MTFKHSVFIFLSLTLWLWMGSTHSSIAKHRDIDLLLKNHQFNGVTLVTTEETVVLHKGYGTAIREWAIQNDSTTKFRIASLSKTFTEVLI